MLTYCRYKCIVAIADYSTWNTTYSHKEIVGQAGATPLLNQTADCGGTLWPYILGFSLHET
jgi:hypothetical protein